MIHVNTLMGWRRLASVALLVLFAVALVPGAYTTALAADDNNLEELLEQVGEDYAVSYTSPFLYAFGPNQNSGMYQTASIPWTGLTFGFGVKVMAASLNSDDQTFRKVIHDVDLGDYDPDYAGQTGDIVMSGPTIFGNTDTNGTITGYVHGAPVFQQEGIPGLVETSLVPMFAPEAYIGGLYGLKFTIRYFPEIDLSDYGKTKYFGYGLQWNANGVLKDLPVDIMVGFFTQKLDVGTLMKTNASTYFAGVSKEFGILTAYGGLASESSDMEVAYTYIDGMDTQAIGFKVDGKQKSRFTLGASINFGVNLYLEMGHGNLTTYSSGLMFGF